MPELSDLKSAFGTSLYAFRMCVLKCFCFLDHFQKNYPNELELKSTKKVTNLLNILK